MLHHIQDTGFMLVNWKLLDGLYTSKVVSRQCILDIVRCWPSRLKRFVI